ncbi:uncharacterized protein EV420DRAFT_1537785 [Desarmillaria tabescens]|uniref:RlpA-like protein double-psi beta-barrel domain-containing protein n=1 Tax=Armillaria tabescens TaxID=1929756 RepID=A0AA39N713_ARMTA|nr:uncharacterized protein EV420DRAFT_1537785 [Desarmillaria tabescens]KAK0459799.1 hypothetical protein EV420DRAFT_1537785 [Desarmillaria tabescens]
MFASVATIALVTIAAVQATPHFPRRSLHGVHHVVRSKPADYAEGYLESYDVYHARYLAIGCQNQHNTQFFDDCCHPLLANETVAANRPAYCSATASASSSASAVVATSTDTSDDSGEYYDCDDDASSSATSSSTDYVPATTSSSSSEFSQAASTSAPESSSTVSSSSSSASVTQDNTWTQDTNTWAAATTSSSESSWTPEPTTSSTSSTTQEQNTDAQKNTQTQETSTSSSATSQSTGTSNASSGSSSSSSGTFYSGGVGTFYYQYGVAGSCGTVHADSDKIVAVSAIVMNSALCGKTITLTNTANGKTVNAVIADTCPGCGDGGASIDCSTGTFDALADESDGTFPVTFTLPAV